MPDELTELLETAIYKEVASQAFYIAGQDKTPDLGARALLAELAKEELGHSQRMKELRDSGVEGRGWSHKEIPNLKISEYLTAPDTLEGTGLQDTLIFAMKREQHSVEFYTRLMGTLRDETAKHLCERLVHEELQHKLRLERLYEDMFLGED